MRDEHFHSFGRKRVGHLLSRFGGAERDDGRARPRPRRVEGARPLRHVDQPGNLGRDPIPGPLVNLVSVRRPEESGISGDETGGQGGDPGQAAKHAIVRMGRLDDASSVLGGKMVARSADYDLEGGVDRETQRQALGRHQIQPPIDGGGHVVGVALQLDRLPVDAVGAHFVFGQAQRCRDPGYGGSRRRAEALADRDVGIDLDAQRKILAHHPAGSGQDPILLPWIWAMQPDMLDAPFIGATRLDGTSDLQRQRQTVESGPQVGGSRRGRSSCRMEVLAHARRLFGVSVPEVGDILDFENLLPELIVGLGLALIVGNGLAWWRHRQGRAPSGVENAQYRGARVAFLLAVGVLMTAWGAVSLLT